MASKRVITFTISRNPEVTKANTQMALRKAAGHLQRGELEAAQLVALNVVQAEPQNFDALHMLGVIAGRNQQQAEAIALISKALALKPDAQAYCNRAAARLVLQHHAKTLADCDQAIALNPGLATAHCLRGHALAALKRNQETFAAYDRAVTLNPEYAEAWHHRGHACLNLGLIQNAIASYDRALLINPDNPGSLGNRSLCYLLTGDFERGWAHFGERWSVKPKGSTLTPGPDAVLFTPDDFRKPVWDGKPSEKTLLIWPEQGIGDQILFASLLPQLRPLAGKVILALEERLHALYARSFPWCEITTLKAAREAGQYDLQIPVGDLGRLFRHSAADFLQHRNAFLKADVARSARMRQAIAPAAGERICGISWRSVHPEFGKDKSIPLAELRPLLETPGWRFVDLQYGDTAAERAILKSETGIDIAHIDDLDMVRDIDGLAALIGACDTIVTISNTNAHIAGALGKDVQLMLPFNAARFWYWQAERKDSLWYPQMQMLRQQSSGGWQPVIKQVCTALPAAKSSTKSSTKTVVKKNPAPKKATPPTQKAAAKKHSPSLTRSPAKKPATARKKRIATK
jgi:tetratricopeptide (TPR) repeat protein